MTGDAPNAAGDATGERPPPPPPSAGWIEAAVPAPPGGYARFAADVVGPLMDDMVAQGTVERWLFWPDGTGLRLGALASSAGARARLVERLRGACADVTTNEVATPTLLAALPWGSRSRVVGEDLLSDLAPGIVTLLEDGRHGSVDVGLELMTAHLAAVGDGAVAAAIRPPDGPAGDALLGFLSYRSHAEGFFLMCKDPERARAAFEERYLDAAPVLERRVRAVLDELRHGGQVVFAHATWWHDAVRRHLPAAVESFRAAPAASVRERGYLGDGHDLRDSPFHRVIDESPGFQEFLRADPAFQAVRLSTSILYLCLRAAGLRLIDRYFLCHAIANACESLYRVDSVELVRRFANHHRALPGSGRSGDATDRGGPDEMRREHEHRPLAVASSQKEKP